MIRSHPRSTLFPSPPLSRSRDEPVGGDRHGQRAAGHEAEEARAGGGVGAGLERRQGVEHRLGVLAALGQQIGRHTSELQSRQYLVCRLLLEKKKKIKYMRLL